MTKTHLSTLVAVFTSALLLPNYGTAFVLPSTKCVPNAWGIMPMITGSDNGSDNSAASASTSASTTSLFAKKKRRRRKNTEDNAQASTSNSRIQINDKNGGLNDGTDNDVVGVGDDDDELPDFDLIEDIDLEESLVVPSSYSKSLSNTGVAPTPSSSSSNKKSFDVNDPAVLAAMRATKGLEGGSASTKDLLRSRNRDLESRLVVNEIKEDVPSLADYTRGKGKGGSTGTSNVVVNGNDGYNNALGKKAARREARIAAAMEAEGGGEVEEVGVLGFLEKLPFADKLPFLKKEEEKEKKTAVKLLEEGTWACIYILVGWEIYINSPLFSRAGPMAPVVFTDPMTMT